MDNEKLIELASYALDCEEPETYHFIPEGLKSITLIPCGNNCMQIQIDNEPPYDPVCGPQKLVSCLKTILRNLRANGIYEENSLEDILSMFQ